MKIDDKLIKDSAKNKIKGFAAKFPDIQYNSILLMEIIKIEDYDKLIKNLENIFSELDSIDYLKIQKAEEMLKNQNKQIFRDKKVVLPFISHSKFRGKIPPDNRVFLDLGTNVDHVQISVHNFSPSYILFDLRCLLNQQVSEKLNSIINGIPKSILEKRTNLKGDYNEQISPERLKEKKISDLKYLIKKEMIDIFSNYFKGKFMTNSLEKKDYSIVPGIDIFSLDFPLNNVEKWCETNKNLFNMFSIVFSADTAFQFERYLFFKEDRSLRDNLNYLIFARSYQSIAEKSKKTKEQQKIDEINPENLNIVNGLIKCPFSLLAVEREVDSQVTSINKINSIIEEEMRNLKNEDIKSLLEKTETIFRGKFEFERFKIETNSYVQNLSFCQFFSLNNQNEFFDILKTTMKVKLELIENITLKYSKQAQANLELKNMDYNRKYQNTILGLTVVVGFFTFIQVLGLLNGVDLSPFILILNNFAGPIFIILLLTFFLILI